MCDTFVALKNSTSDGSVIFAKNSDRHVNEGHELRYFPRQEYDPEHDIVKTTYLELPQVEETYAILLSSPYWLYGCEMGTNEYGVTIGNEAVFTKEPEREKGLLGMDFTRLALERSKTAHQALEIMIKLLEQYGQGGNCCIPGEKETYHNSWMIVHLNEAWVLETADRWWIAEKVKDSRTISNALTIGVDYDLIHPDLLDYAIEKGYCKNKTKFNWKKAFTAGIMDIRTWGGLGTRRHEFTTKQLKDKKGEIDPAFMMKLLRSHNLKGIQDDKWNPSKSRFNTICVHARPYFVPSQSTASQVSHLKEDINVHWFTGTSAPCTSLFKPFFVESGIPDLGPQPTNKYNEKTLWWYHEKIHRAILEDYLNRIKMIQPDIIEFEKKWVKDIPKRISNFTRTKDENSKGNLNLQKNEIIRNLKNITEEAFQDAQKYEKSWFRSLVEQNPPIIKRSGGIWYRRYWKNQNKKALLDL